MLRLLKYELRKTLLAKLVLLGITLFTEVIFLIGLTFPKLFRCLIEK